MSHDRHTAMASDEHECGSHYGQVPSYAELVMIILVGTGHVIAELATSLSGSRAYNLLAAVVLLSYVTWRAVRTPEALHVWGLRCDNFWAACKLNSLFAIPAILAMIGISIVAHRPVFVPTFAVAVVPYVLWGIVQQFALQNLLARNLVDAIPNGPLCALVAALLFSLSHTPRGMLVLLTLVAGFFLTVAYRRQPNLWAVGLVHGLLGTVAFYTLLGEDPGDRILTILQGVWKAS